MEERSKEAAPVPEDNSVGAYPAAEKSSAKERDAVIRRRLLPRGGRLFGPLLGLLFLAYPVGALLALDPSLTQLVFALVGTALFAGIFLWLIWLHEPLQATADASEIRKRRAAVASLAILALALALVFGAEWLALFFQINVVAGIMLPRRDAYVAILGSAFLMVTFGRVSNLGWLDIGQAVLSTSALGLLFTAFARQIAIVAELRAAREEITRLAVAEERLRFARDLHDLLGHSLSLITLKSELAGRLLPAAPERAATEVRDIEDVARRALSEVREAVAGYRRPTLDEELDGAREMLEAAGITCHVENEAGVLPNAMDAVLAWAVREGVTNVIRHSYAKRCEIRVAREGEQIHTEVSDDGRGSSPGRHESPTGSGLSGLAERVAASGGDFEARSLPEGGFRLRVSLPILEGADIEPVSRASNVREKRRR